MSEYTDDELYEKSETTEDDTDDEKTLTDDEKTLTDDINTLTDNVITQTMKEAATLEMIEKSIRNSQPLETNDKDIFMSFLQQNNYILRALDIGMFRLRDDTKFTASLSNVIEIIPYHDMIKCYFVMYDDPVERSFNEYVIGHCIIPTEALIYEDGEQKRRLIEYDFTHADNKKYKIHKKAILNYYNIDYNYNDGVFYRVF